MIKSAFELIVSQHSIVGWRSEHRSGSLDSACHVGHFDNTHSNLQVHSNTCVGRYRHGGHLEADSACGAQASVEGVCCVSPFSSSGHVPLFRLIHVCLYVVSGNAEIVDL